MESVVVAVIGVLVAKLAGRALGSDISAAVAGGLAAGAMTVVFLKRARSPR